MAMTAAEAHAAAASEGLALLRAENATGFKHVCLGNNVSKPFTASLRHNGSFRHLGVFATAEEAALAVARFLGPEGDAASPAVPSQDRKRSASPIPSRSKRSITAKSTVKD